MLIMIKKAKKERDGTCKEWQGRWEFLKRYDGHGRPLSKDPVETRCGVPCVVM